MHTGAEDVAVDDVVLQMARCDAQEVGVVDDGVAPRATQTVPPKTRRQVLLRHGGRCAVPGCSHAVFAQVHHVVPRADDGGSTIPMGSLRCSAHHDAVHRGTLVVTGTFSAGFGFRHADGGEYGSPHMCAGAVGW
ncbi:MAG: HNH endonuclease signature motif containing protein [Sandaracinaceae bacterium]